MKGLLFIFALFFIITSCRDRKFANGNDHNITHIYTDHDSAGNPLDSLKLYDERPFEESLVFYTDTDSLEKNVFEMIYLSVFKIENSKFAILADSTHTSFYKFMPEGHKRLYRVDQSATRNEN